MRVSAIITLLLVLLLSPTATTVSHVTAGTHDNAAGADTEAVDAAPEPNDNVTAPNRHALLTTSEGVIEFILFENLTPITTANFIALAEDGFYDGCKFHRVIDDFVIQTGDPNSKNDFPYDDGTGGSDETIPLEVCDELTHIDGAVGMARSSDPDSASSQFYLCDGPQHGLDGDYAVFGVVVEGMEVVRAIASTETWGYRRPLLKDRPVEDIVLERVEIVASPAPANTTAVDAPKGAPPTHLLFGFEATLVLATVIIVVSMTALSRRRP